VASHWSLKTSIEKILSRQTAEGGFVQRQGGISRPDATAWSILSLAGERCYREIIEKACRWLAQKQLVDGRVPISDGCRESCWPTSLAVLAWKKSGGFEKEIKQAKRFLLENRGRHFPKEKNSPIGHDTSIRGWSWMANMHSWIEPTSMAIISLKAVGFTEQAHVREAVSMILDRQLPSGGWNYGNTAVYNKELYPMPEYTGQALCALSGFVLQHEVEKSIEYARLQVIGLQTPLSLCWCCCGLRAWGIDTNNFQKHILHSLSLQDKYGPYNTTLLAQLVVTYHTNGDFLGFLLTEDQQST